MGFLRKLLGLFVMLAGIIGLILAIGGIVGTWMYKPMLISRADATITSLTASIDTSTNALVVTDGALGETVKSIDALAEMLQTTSLTVTDTQPVIQEVNIVLGETLPKSIDAATDSLNAAGEAAGSLEDAIKSFEAFRSILSGVPFIGMSLPPVSDSYSPQKPLALSLEELATSLEDMPQSFVNIAEDLNKSDDNLESVKGNLDTMAVSVSAVSDSLRQYQDMLGDSQASMVEVKNILENSKSSLPTFLTYAAYVLTLFFVWFLAAQVVIFSQGLELFHGTATRMDVKPTAQPVTAEAETKPDSEDPKV